MTFRFIVHLPWVGCAGSVEDVIAADGPEADPAAAEGLRFGGRWRVRIEPTSAFPADIEEHRKSRVRHLGFAQVGRCMPNTTSDVRQACTRHVPVDPLEKDVRRAFFARDPEADANYSMGVEGVFSGRIKR